MWSSSSIEQEKINKRGEKDENTNPKCFSKFRNIGNYVGNCITNKYIRVNNWKFNPTLKSKDTNLHKFQEKSRKKEIFEKLNELVQLPKDEGIKTEKSSYLSYSYNTTLVESFKRTYSVVERSSEDSTLNEQLFRMGAQLVKENDKLKTWFLRNR